MDKHYIIEYLVLLVIKLKRVEANNAEEALKAFREKDPDSIVNAIYPQTYTVV